MSKFNKVSPNNWLALDTTVNISKNNSMVCHGKQMKQEYIWFIIILNNYDLAAPVIADTARFKTHGHAFYKVQYH